MPGKEESVSRSRHSGSPVSLHSQNTAFAPGRFNLRHLQDIDDLSPWSQTSPFLLLPLLGELFSPAESHPEALPSLSGNLFKPNSVHALPPTQDDASKEDVIFFWLVFYLVRANKRRCGWGLEWLSLSGKIFKSGRLFDFFQIRLYGCVAWTWGLPVWFLGLDIGGSLQASCCGASFNNILKWLLVRVRPLWLFLFLMYMAALGTV